MSKKLVIILLAALALAAILVAGGAGGFLLYRKYEYANYLNQAREYAQNEQWHEAQLFYRTYLSRYPNDLRVLEDYAEVCKKNLMGRRAALHAALEAYFQIYSNEPTNNEVRKKIIDLCMHLESWHDLEYYTSIFLRDDPEDLELKYFEAIGLDGLGRDDEAAACLQALVESQTPHLDVYTRLARLLEKKNKVDDAKATLDRLTELHGSTPEVHFELAEYFLEKGDWEKARQHLAEADEKQPDSGQASLLRGQLALFENDYKGAVENLKAAVERDPTKGSAYALLTFALNAGGDPEAAIEVVNGMDPYVLADFPDLYRMKAEIQLSMNRLEDLSATLTEYQRVCPEHRLAFEYIEGRKLLAEGQPLRAAEKLSGVVKNNPDIGAAQYYLAVAYLNAQNRGQARNVLESYIDDHPEDARAQALYDSEFAKPLSNVQATSEGEKLLANSEASLSDLLNAARHLLDLAASSSDAARPLQTEMAEKLMAKAIEVAPETAAAYQNLALQYARTKRSNEAKAIIERALSNGIPESEFGLSRGAIALAEANIEGAKTIYQQELERQEFTVEDALRWANLFADAGYIEEGEAAVQLAVSKPVGGEPRVLEQEIPLLYARNGRIETALQWLTALDAKYVATPEDRGAILDLKLQLATRLLRAEEAPNIEEANRLLAEVEREAPNNVQMLVLKTEAILKDETPDLALAALTMEKALSLEKNNLAALLLMTEIQRRESKLESALTYARRAADQSPNNVETSFTVAQLQAALQRNSEAQQTLEALLASHPYFAAGLQLLVDSYMDSGKLKQAEMRLGQLRELVHDDPLESSRLDALEGELLLRQGTKLDRAEQLLRARYGQSPDDAKAALDLARILVRLDKSDEARQVVEEYKEAHSDNPEAWFVAGQYYLGLTGAEESLAEASSAFTRALVLDPAYVPAMGGLIEVQLRSGRSYEALALCGRYLEERPDSPSILYQKAALLLNQGRFSEARQAIDRALELDDTPEYRYLRGMVHLAEDRPQPALDDLRKAYEDAGAGFTSAAFDLALAEAYWGVGQRELGRQFFETAKEKARRERPLPEDRVRRFEEKLEAEKAG